MTRVNKKALSVGVLALSMLVACSCGDTITAHPTFYDDPILDSNTTLTHNTMSVIYDALSSNSTNSEKVLNAVLDDIAIQYFGTYADAKRLSTTDVATAKAFLDAHEFYKAQNGKDEYTDEEKFEKLQNFVKDMEERIVRAYYDEAASGTYSYRNRFDEEKLIQKLRADLYIIGDAAWYKNVLVTENYKTDLTGLIHVEQYDDYTTRYLVTKFYREYLIEQYMYSENYSLLGRSYARKINYIALPVNSKYPGAAKNLLAAFAEKYIEDPTLGTDEVQFDVVAEAWRGYNPDGELSAEAKALLDAAGFEKKNITYDYLGYPVTTEYYPATKYGDMIEKYAKITDDRDTTENQDDFTGTNTYPKEIGLTMKLDELSLEDYTTDGWFNKSGTTDLPDTIKKRLFNINVANEVDHLGVTQDVNGLVTNEDATVEFNSGDYVTKKNGNYWLVPSGAQKVDINKYNYIISENSTFYMIQINEAVSTSKLSTTDNNINNYAHLRGGNSIHHENNLFTDKIAYAVAKLYDSNDTYKNNAYSKYIEDSGIIYYDQDIYDYFKEKFPELFD